MATVPFAAGDEGAVIQSVGRLSFYELKDLFEIPGDTLKAFALLLPALLFAFLFVACCRREGRRSWANEPGFVPAILFYGHINSALLWELGAQAHMDELGAHKLSEMDESWILWEERESRRKVLDEIGAVEVLRRNVDHPVLVLSHRNR